MDTELTKQSEGNDDVPSIWPPAFMLGMGFGVQPPEPGSADEDVEDSIGGE